MKFAFANSRSVRNKGPLISELLLAHKIDILAIAETHIRFVETPSFLDSITPPGFKFFQRPRLSGLGGGVGFLVNKSISCKVVDSPSYNSFENIVTL